MARRLKVLSYKVVPLSVTSLIAEEAEPLEVTLNGFHRKATSQLLTAATKARPFGRAAALDQVRLPGHHPPRAGA